ncbi:alpha/beta hydrolase [Phaeovulum sp. W22_SRMD_FR3]|uniref:alpha/beta hydrolase n=1 Tax=Phaeovulum sp. W22_SRMD_FR3 TaxID=3240274 RepID=UPI003F95774F
MTGPVEEKQMSRPRLPPEIPVGQSAVAAAGAAQAAARLVADPPASHSVVTRILPRATCGESLPGGPAYRLFLAVPHRAAPAAGAPILYMLDGNAAFAALTPALLAAVPGLVVAGIGYDMEAAFARGPRNLDYTPAAPGVPPFPDPVQPAHLAGGAAVFLDRLCGPIRAGAEADLRIDPARRMLWGHSFGGLCTLTALLTRPEAFARYGIISPSVWWDPARIAALEAAAAFDAADPKRVYLAVGECEKHRGSPAPAAGAASGPPPLTMALAGRLAARPGLALTCAVLAGAVHIDSLAQSLPGSLALAAG